MKTEWCDPCGNPIVCCTCPTDMVAKFSLDGKKPKKEKAEDKKEKNRFLTLKFF